MNRAHEQKRDPNGQFANEGRGGGSSGVTLMSGYIDDWSISDTLQQAGLLKDALIERDTLDSAVSSRRLLSGAEFDRHCYYVDRAIKTLFPTHSTMDEGETLDDRFGDDPQRLSQHEEILNELYDQYSHTKRERKAIVAAGLPGSGKSYTLKTCMGVKGGDYATINPDDIKEMMADRDMIPEVPGMTPMDASPLIHEEASALAKQLESRLAREGVNLILDMTMANKTTSRRRIQALKDLGYNDIQPVLVDVTTQISATKANERYRHGIDNYTASHLGNGGRFVPSALIMKNEGRKGLRSVNAENYVELYEEGVLSGTPIVFDNRAQGRDPIPVEFESMRAYKNRPHT